MDIQERAKVTLASFQQLKLEEKECWRRLKCVSGCIAELRHELNQMVREVYEQKFKEVHEFDGQENLEKAIQLIRQHVEFVKDDIHIRFRVNDNESRSNAWTLTVSNNHGQQLSTTFTFNIAMSPDVWTFSDDLSSAHSDDLKTVLNDIIDYIETSMNVELYACFHPDAAKYASAVAFVYDNESRVQLNGDSLCNVSNVFIK